MKNVIVLLIAMIYGNTAYAGIPTIDVANIAQSTITATESLKQTANMVQSIAKQAQQYEKQIQQYAQQVEQYAALTGNKGISKLLNSKVDQLARRYMPTSWEDAVAIAAHENAQVDEALSKVQNAIKKSRAKHIKYQGDKVYGTQAFYKEARDNLDDINNSVTSAMGLSQATYARVGDRIVAAENLMRSIDQSQDLKTSVDLGNRINVETNMNMTALIQQLALLNIQQSEVRASQAGSVSRRNAKSGSSIPDDFFGNGRKNDEMQTSRSY